MPGGKGQGGVGVALSAVIGWDTKLWDARPTLLAEGRGGGGASKTTKYFKPEELEDVTLS